MKIELTRGFYAVIDPEDWEIVSAYKWTAGKGGGGRWYARHLTSQNGKRTYVHMHRLILNAPAGMLVDHIDGNPLNNTRKNLRLCTHAQNMQNAARPLPSTGVRNVRLLPKSGRFRAKVSCDKIVYQKNFVRLEDAAAWATAMRIKLHMDFAVDHRPCPPTV